jgi:hypothetical protein
MGCLLPPRELLGEVRCDRLLRPRTGRHPGQQEAPTLGVQLDRPIHPVLAGRPRNPPTPRDGPLPGCACLMVNGVGEPCAGEPHARFDGRGLARGNLRHQPVLDPTGFESWRDLKRRKDTGFSRVPSHLAHHPRLVRQYRTDATLSRLLPPSPPIHGSGCLQLHPAATTAKQWTVSHLHMDISASWRTGTGRRRGSRGPVRGGTAATRRVTGHVARRVELIASRSW